MRWRLCNEAGGGGAVVGLPQILARHPSVAWKNLLCDNDELSSSLKTSPFIAVIFFQSVEVEWLSTRDGRPREWSEYRLEAKNWRAQHLSSTRSRRMPMPYLFSFYGYNNKLYWIQSHNYSRASRILFDAQQTSCCFNFISQLPNSSYTIVMY